jgi:hypothetical protein
MNYKDMKLKFWCPSCKKIFDAAGKKKTWIDPIYGPCSKQVGVCPDCTEECNEYRVPVPQKKSGPTPSMGCNRQCHSCEFGN